MPSPSSDDSLFFQHSFLTPQVCLESRGFIGGCVIGLDEGASMSPLHRTHNAVQHSVVFTLASSTRVTRVDPARLNIREKARA